MCHRWKEECLTKEEAVLDVLVELCGKRWLSRGQSKRYDGLVPSIDRKKDKDQPQLSRIEKLRLERQSINLFRSTARFFSHPGEEPALTDDIIALMVLRHYGVPTRLLDWSISPWVAAYFAVENYDSKPGYIWSFDEPLYEEKGREQWKKWPETCHFGDPDKFDAKLTAFAVDPQCDWFICGFYPFGFHRQNALAGAYSLTAKFDCDHAEKIAGILDGPSHYRLYVIRAKLKSKLRRILYEKYGIWRGSLFCDSPGAADTARKIFNGN